MLNSLFAIKQRPRPSTAPGYLCCLAISRKQLLEIIDPIIFQRINHVAPNTLFLLPMTVIPVPCS